jgi:hypothetical protein
VVVVKKLSQLLLRRSKVNLLKESRQPSEAERLWRVV